QNCVRLVGIERAIGLIGDLKARKLDSGVEAQGLVGAEAKDRAVGGNGLAGHVIRRLAGHQALLRDKKPARSCKAGSAASLLATCLTWLRADRPKSPRISRPIHRIDCAPRQRDAEMHDRMAPAPAGANGA